MAERPTLMEPLHEARQRDDTGMVSDGDILRSQRCRCWRALPQVDKTVVLNIAANWATIISAVPVAIAASSAR